MFNNYPTVNLNSIQVVKTDNPEDGYSSKDKLYSDVIQHKKDVSKMMNEIGVFLSERGEIHDWTKLFFFNDFAKDTLERQDTPNFKEREWYNIHCTHERHHLNASCPDDVDLFDVLEMIVDCIIAGETRNGSVNLDFLELSDDILIKSYWNTVEKIMSSITMVEEDSKKSFFK